MAITTPHPAGNSTASDPEQAGPAGLDWARVSDVMNPGLISCDGSTSLRVVAGTMAEARIHCVVVEGVGGAERSGWGIVSDLDLVRAGALGQADGTAAEVAATELLTVAAEDTLAHAAQLMSEHEVAHLIVVDSAVRPVGVISTLDLAAALCSPASGP